MGCVAPAGGFTSRLRCASLKGLYKPEDAFNETGWVRHMHTFAYADIDIQNILFSIRYLSHDSD